MIFFFFFLICAIIQKHLYCSVCRLLLNVTAILFPLQNHPIHVTSMLYNNLAYTIGSLISLVNTSGHGTQVFKDKQLMTTPDVY